MLQSSQALNAVLAEILDSHHDQLSEALSITTGYDNDGSTGIDMVEIGIGLGFELAQMVMEKGKAEVWLAQHPTEHKGWPIVAESEEDAIAILRCL
jgi:hypothetical protein